MKHITFNNITTSVFFVLSLVISSTGSPDSDTNKLHHIALNFFSDYNIEVEGSNINYSDPNLHFLKNFQKSFILDSSILSINNSYIHSSRSPLYEHSLEIGLNPSLYIGKNIIMMNYLAKNVSQSGRKIAALIFFHDTTIIGAYLLFEGWGSFSMNNRSMFQPENFIFPHFRPDRLDTISIFGPWKGNCGWEKRVDFVSKTELTYISNLLSNSKKTKKKFKTSVDTIYNLYAIRFRFVTGELWIAQLQINKDTSYVTCSDHYILNINPIDFINEKFKSMGKCSCYK